MVQRSKKAKAQVKLNTRLLKDIDITRTFNVTAVARGSGYDIKYDSATGELSIGCQTHSLTEWKQQAEAIVYEQLSLTLCDCCEACDEYAARERPKVKRQAPKLAAQIRELIAYIEQEERTGV